MRGLRPPRPFAPTVVGLGRSGQRACPGTSTAEEGEQKNALGHGGCWRLLMGGWCIADIEGFSRMSGFIFFFTVGASLHLLTGQCF